VALVREPVIANLCAIALIILLGNECLPKFIFDLMLLQKPSLFIWI